jgi:hypothetical protein
MNNDNGLPPLEPINTDNPPPPAGSEQLPPPGSDPGLPPPQNFSMSYDTPKASGNIHGSFNKKLAIVAVISLFSLLVPMGLYKIGSPAGCSEADAKKGNCVIVKASPKCSPKVFLLESQYLECKMVGYGSPEFLEKSKVKHDRCVNLENTVKNKGFRCYATEAILKKKFPTMKEKDLKVFAFKSEPLAIQKLSALNSIPKDALFTDFVFTMLLMLVLLIFMGVAAYLSHKKNKEKFIYVVGVFGIGMIASLSYRFYVAGFYNGEVVILLISLLGAIPIAFVTMGASGKIGRASPVIIPSGDDPLYELKPPEPPKPVIEEAVLKAEATKFEKMALQHSKAGDIITIALLLIGSFYLMIMGLGEMGKSSKASSKMDEQSANLMKMKKKKNQPTSDDFDEEGENGDNGDNGDDD